MADQVADPRNTFFQNKNHIKLARNEANRQTIFDSAVQRADALGKTILSGGTQLVITATTTPATSVLVVGEALEDTTNWATFLNTSNYATSADSETIDTVVVNYIGDTANATETLEAGESNHFSITVTDTAANERTFTTIARTVASASDWILETGSWDDSGTWDDSSNWNDATDWILETGSWDDSGTWDDSSNWKDAA